jgi:chromosome segregation ATPase
VRIQILSNDNDKLLKTIDLKNQDLDSYKKRTTQLEIELAHYRSLE